jgi:radical SAM protein with 4Fe4S-binding SPASM domain
MNNHDQKGMLRAEFQKITREKFYRAIKEEAKPLLAWFSLTDDCNLRCRYCFADAHFCQCNLEQAPERKNDPLSTKDVYAILDNVAEAGTIAIQFAGGEPTIRDDLADLIWYATEMKGMFIALNTNGTLLDDWSIKRLAVAGLGQVKVSVDGLKESHDWNRGKGTFEKAINTLKGFKAAGVPSVILIMTLSKINYHELPEMIALCKDLGVQFTMVEFLPLGHAHGKRDWVLTKEQRKETQRYLFTLQKKEGLTNIIFENRYIVSEQEETKKLLVEPCARCGFFDFGVGCISGIYNYMITASGKVATGDMLHLEIGDLKKQSLKEIWENAEMLKLLRNRENLKGKCGRCTYKYVCGGCRRAAYIFTGDLMGPDPYCWVEENEEDETIR